MLSASASSATGATQQTEPAVTSSSWATLSQPPVCPVPLTNQQPPNHDVRESFSVTPVNSSGDKGGFPGPSSSLSVKGATVLHSSAASSIASPTISQPSLSVASRSIHQAVAPRQTVTAQAADNNDGMPMSSADYALPRHHTQVGSGITIIPPTPSAPPDSNPVIHPPTGSTRFSSRRAHASNVRPTIPGVEAGPSVTNLIPQQRHAGPAAPNTQSPLAATPCATIGGRRESVTQAMSVVAKTNELLGNSARDLETPVTDHQLPVTVVSTPLSAGNSTPHDPQPRQQPPPHMYLPTLSNAETQPGGMTRNAVATKTVIDKSQKFSESTVCAPHNQIPDTSILHVTHSTTTTNHCSVPSSSSGHAMPVQPQNGAQCGSIGIVDTLHSAARSSPHRPVLTIATDTPTTTKSGIKITPNGQSVIANNTDRSSEYRPLPPPPPHALKDSQITQRSSSVVSSVPTAQNPQRATISGVDTIRDTTHREPWDRAAPGGTTKLTERATDDLTAGPTRKRRRLLKIQ